MYWAQLMKRIFESWPYLFIAISAIGLAYMAIVR